jgi:hypothetical protein
MRDDKIFARKNSFAKINDMMQTGKYGRPGKLFF